MRTPALRTVELPLAPMASNWLTERVIANPISIHPEYAERRSSRDRTMRAGVVRTRPTTASSGWASSGAARHRPPR